MQGKKSAFLVALLLCINGCSSEHDLTGYSGSWTGNDTVTTGIMGDFLIAGDTISFGNRGFGNKAPVCTASYTAHYQRIKKEYTLTLHNKKCDYSSALNPGYLKPLQKLVVYLSNNPFGNKDPFSKEKKTENVGKTHYLFIRTPKGNTDYRFIRQIK